MKSVGRRSLALILSVLMTLSLISTVSFAEGNVAADAQNQEADKQVVQEVQPDAAETPAAVAEDKTEAEAKQPTAPVEKAFSQSKIVDGVKVAVTADKGVFPADAQLSVTKVAVPAAVDTKDAAKAYAFDITILAGGKKIQPDGRANVSFTTAEVAQYDTDVYHMAGATAQKMGDSENGNTTSVVTSSFSVYVLSLKTDAEGAETKTMKVELNKTYTFSEILTAVGESASDYSTQYGSKNAGVTGVDIDITAGTVKFTAALPAGAANPELQFVTPEHDLVFDNPDLVVTLVSVENRFEATFMNGDTQVGDKVVAEADGKVTPPAAPTVDPTGATDTEFKYWYTTDASAEYDFNTPIAEDTTFYAKWDKKAALKATFMNGEEQVAEVEADADGKVTPPAAPTVDPTGATDTEFKYWYTTDASTEYNFSTPITENTTFNAKWGPASEATGWDVDYNEDQSVATLTYHDSTSRLDGKSFTVSLTAEDMYYDTVGEIYDSAELKVEAEGGGEVPEEVTSLIGGKRYGKPGNAITTKGDTKIKTPDDPKKVKGYWVKVTLPQDRNEPGTAKYIFAKYSFYRVTVELDEGFVKDDGKEIVKTAKIQPANANAAFVYSVDSETGPFSDEAKNTGYLAADNPHSLYYKVIPTDSNADALFGPAKAGEFNVTEGTTYQVTFNANGGSPEPEAQTVPAGGKAKAPTETVTKEGFTLDGWFLDEETTPFDFENREITGSIELKAHWTATPAHEHNWDFSRAKPDENGVRHIYCKNEGCAYYTTGAELSLSPKKDVFYSGEDINIEGKVEKDPEKLFTIKDIKINGSEEADLTQPGRYTAIGQFYISGRDTSPGTVWRTYTVVKATVEPNGSGEANNEFDYGDTANLVKDPAWEPAQNGYTIKYKLDDAAEYADAIPKAEGLDAGNHKVTWQVFDSEGIAVETAAATGTIPIIIRQKEIVVTPPTTQNKVYNAQLQTIATPAETPLDPAVEGLTLKYAVSEKGKSGSLVEWDTTIPQKKDAATYEIALKVFAGDNPVTGNNYKFVVAKGGDEYDFDTPLEATIAKADPMDPDNGAVEPEGVNIPYNGEGQKLVEKDTGKTVDYEDAPPILYSLSKDDGYGETIPTGTDVNNYIVYWKVVGNDNYEDASGQFTSKIYQEEYLTPPVAAKDLVYDGNDKQLLSKAAVLGEEAPEGAQIVYAVTDSDTPPAADKYSSPYDSEALPVETVGEEAGEYYIWYKVVKDDADLTPADFVIAEIDKADPEFTTEPEPLFPMYAGVGRWVNTKGATSDGTILFSYDGGEEYGNRAKQIDAGEYEVWYYIKGDKNHYDSEPATLDAEITPRVVVLAWDGDEYTYDGTKKQPTATVTNLVTREDTGEQDEVTVTVGGGQTDVGEYTGENGAVATELGGADAKNYTLPEEPYHDFSIIQQQVIIRWFEKEGASDPLDEDPAYTYNGQIQGPVAVVYNLDGTAPIEGLGVTLTGLEKDATPDGEKYTATVTGLTGEKKDNYEIATTDPDTKTQDYTITPKTITIASGIKVKDKEYDKKPDAELSNDYSAIKFDGLVEGDEGKVTVTALEGTAAYNDVNAGTSKDADVNITKVTLGGESADNYTVETPFNAVTKGTINKKPVTIASGIEANDKVYDGNPKATLDLSEAVLDGVIDGDEVTVVLYDEEDLEAQFADKNVGEWDVTFDAYWGLDIDGANADNYYLAREGNQEKARAKITQRPISIEGIKAKDKIYDGNKEATLDGSTAKIIDGIFGDNVFVKTDLTVKGTFDTKDVGQEIPVAIDLTGLTAENLLTGTDAGNYMLDTEHPEKLKLSTTANITQRPVNLEWYKYTDDPEAATGKIDYIYNGKLQAPVAKVGNLVAGDVVGVNVDVPGHKKDVGEYTAKATELTGTDSGNYKLTPSDKLFTVSKLTVTVDGIMAKNKTYDGNTVATLDASNAQIITKVENDDVKVVVDGNGTFEDKNAGTDKNVTIAPAEISLSGTDAKNYNLDKENSQKTTKANIDKRVADIAWDPQADPAEFTYNGEEQAPKATVSNKVPGDDLKADVGGAQTDASDTPYTATVTLSGDDAGNYVLPDPAPTKQFVIKKAELTVTASDQTIYYGEDFEKTKVTYSGWVKDSDNEDTALTTKAQVTSNYYVNAKPGTYKLTPSGAAAKNYTFKYVDGKLTVKNKVTWLVAKAASQGSKRGRLSWNKVTGAKTYEVWFARCNSKTKKYRMKKVATVKGNSYTKGGLKKGVCYKYYVIAKDAKGKRIAKSLDAHFAVGNNNRAGTNCKTLTVNKTSVSLAAGKTFTIKAKQMGYVAKKRLLDGTHTKLFRYTSTNKAVATVNAKGKITAVGKGYCQVYVQACNGLWKAINVTVK